VPWSTVDVAPTLAALLGLPVPRQAEGSPLEGVLSLIDSTGNNQYPLAALQDSFTQQRQFVCRYVYSVLYGEEYDECYNFYTGDTCTGANSIDTGTCGCLSEIYRLRSLYVERRGSAVQLYFWRCFFFTGGFVFIILVYLVGHFELYTFADLRSLTGPTSLDYVQEFEQRSGKAQRSNYMQSVTGPLGAAEVNRKAFLTALVLQLLYWFVIGIVFLVVYVIAGWFFLGMVVFHG
jgi:hypothetical protein